MKNRLISILLFVGSSDAFAPPSETLISRRHGLDSNVNNNCSDDQRQRRGQRHRQRHIHRMHSIDIINGSRLDTNQNWATTVLFSKSEDTNENELMETKKSQQQLLLELENKFDYDGRISSKISSPTEGEDEDRLTNANDDATTSTIEHRCALITILG